MNQIEKKTIKGEMKYKNIVILTYKIEYPQIISSKYTRGKERFNNYNKKKAINLEKYIKKATDKLKYIKI